MLTVVTGWSPKGFDEYGRAFLDCWVRFWPRDVRLLVYVEQLHPVPSSHRIELVHLANIPAADCLEIYDNPTCRGREALPMWKDKERQAGYSFRFDAWKFCRQGIIPWHAQYGITSGHMLWLDGDVETIRPVTAQDIVQLLPFGKHVAYLGREPKHSEIGFQLYRIPEAGPMLAEFSRLYSSGEILRHDEWHSAYAFDLARKACPVVKCFNLTPGGSGHVWLNSPLARFMAHHKGKRKEQWRRRWAGAQ